MNKVYIGEDDMPISEGRIKAFQIMQPFIKEGLKVLEEADLLLRDEFDFMEGNMTNYFLDHLEGYYGIMEYKGKEVRRDYHALWEFPEKTEWESKSGECLLIKGKKCNIHFPE